MCHQYCATTRLMCGKGVRVAPVKRGSYTTSCRVCVTYTAARHSRIYECSRLFGWLRQQRLKSKTRIAHTHSIDANVDRIPVLQENNYFETILFAAHITPTFIGKIPTVLARLKRWVCQLSDPRDFCLYRNSQRLIQVRQVIIYWNKINTGYIQTQADACYRANSY